MHVPTEFTNPVYDTEKIPLDEDTVTKAQQMTLRRFHSMETLLQKAQQMTLRRFHSMKMTEQELWSGTHYKEHTCNTNTVCIDLLVSKTTLRKLA